LSQRIIRRLLRRATQPTPNLVTTKDNDKKDRDKKTGKMATG
jgi:hypothetical protein